MLINKNRNDRIMKSPEKDIKTGTVNMFYRLKDVKKNTYMLTEVWKTKKGTKLNFF